MNTLQLMSGRQRLLPACGALWMTLVVVVLFNACSSSSMTVNLLGDSQRLNACGQRIAQPVVVRVYQLQGDKNFRTAKNDFFWSDDKRAIGDQFIERFEVTLRPGENRPIPFKLNEKTAYVAVAADFCKPEGERWRFVYEVRSGKKEISVKLFDGRIELQQD